MDGEFILDHDLLGLRPARGKIQAGYWRGFKELVGRQGGCSRDILERHNIDPEAFEFHDYHVDCTAALNLLDDCSIRFDDPLFGLHLGDLQQPDAFGGIAFVARTAPTFGQALECFTEFSPVVNSPEGEMVLVAGRDVAEFRWNSQLGGGCEQAHFQGMLLILKTLKMLGGTGFKPLHVNLCFDPHPALRQEVAELAGCALLRRSEFNAIAFASDLLDQSNPSRNSLMYSMMTRCLKRMGEAPSGAVANDVAFFIETTLASGVCTVERCADALGTSSRTLQKQLAGENTSFTILLEMGREKLAKRALAGSRASIDDIAFNLGYSDQGSFGRAFRRWTGQTPRAFRINSRAMH
ncbi:AraC family transcriptional regulator [Novosphingobium sp. G106]|uniref:AraC family transcriptional regulator n=1 Tax=Novosphingobium sp. G106 TaxID=2849500 RepID=UPI001C2DE5DF|nr:AraC family transcriptional regulator [Novosphingobium sp. G106]MBV1687188.1 AraC family transcriptional regulator [Novosphingobium sp. G106]